MTSTLILHWLYAESGMRKEPGPAEGSRPGLTQDYFFTRSHLLSDSGWKACSAGMVDTGFR